MLVIRMAESEVLVGGEPNFCGCFISPVKE